MDNITHVKQGELSHFTIVCISYTCIYKCITRYGVTTNSFPNVASPMFASLFYFKWLYISVKWGKGGKKKDRKVTLPWYTFRWVRERQNWVLTTPTNSILEIFLTCDFSDKIFFGNAYWYLNFLKKKIFLPLNGCIKHNNTVMVNYLSMVNTKLRGSTQLF